MHIHSANSDKIICYWYIIIINTLSKYSSDSYFVKIINLGFSALYSKISHYLNMIASNACSPEHLDLLKIYLFQSTVHKNN